MFFCNSYQLIGYVRVCIGFVCMLMSMSMHRIVANVYVYAYAYVYKHSLYETPNRRNMKSDKYQCVHVYVYV